MKWTVNCFTTRDPTLCVASDPSHGHQVDPTCCLRLQVAKVFIGENFTPCCLNYNSANLSRRVTITAIKLIVTRTNYKRVACTALRNANCWYCIRAKQRRSKCKFIGLPISVPRRKSAIAIVNLATILLYSHRVTFRLLYLKATLVFEGNTCI